MTGLYDESSLFRPLLKRRGPRLGPLSVSLAAHAAFFAFAIADPGASRPAAKPKSLFESVFKANAKKLIWYRFDRKLPEVSPQAKGREEPPRTTARNKQTIVSRPEKAPRARQMTWLPAPQLEQKAELKAPNLLAFEAPDVKPPAERAKPKLFVPPPAPPENPREELPAPPEVRADVRDARPLDQQRPRVKGRRFEPPRPKAVEARRELRLENAPEVRAAVTDQRGLDLPAARVRPRTFEAPTRRTVETAKLTLPPPPKIVGTDPAAALPVESARVRGKDFAAPPAGPSAKTELSVAGAPAVGSALLPVQTEFLPETGLAARGREFSLPSPAGRGPAAGVPQLPDAPELPAGESNLSAAVISLTPAAKDVPVLPQGSKAGDFSAGPTPSSKGGDGAPVLSARVSLPGLMIQDSTGRPLPSAIPLAAIQAAPASRENLQVVARALATERRGEVIETETRGKSSATRVSAAPTPQFRGRPVYSLVIQAPNVTSHSGSWLMWFAERDPEAHGGLVAPVPKHKVDPVYTVTAMEERVEGSVRLSAVIRKDGTVTYVSVLRGVDERLDRGAVAAFSKWEFEPAARDGVPVELDAVVEIPFRLAPREPK